MRKQAKTDTKKCPYCTPTDPDNPCYFATAKTVIDGKEYSACCSNLPEIDSRKVKDTSKEPKK